MTLSLSEFKTMLDRYPAKRSTLRTKHRASVALIFRHTRDTGLEVLMIERAIKEGDPWSGHMAFPGGKQEPHDHSSSATAVRETFEEVGLHLRQNQLIGRLSDIVTRHHDNRSLMKVTPWVFMLNHGNNSQDDQEFTLNHEAQSCHWIPLQALHPQHREIMKRPLLKLGKFKLHLTLPQYWFSSKRIWGLSLMILDELQHMIQHNGYQQLKFSKKIKLLFS
jgi:8-oxo-dGTP pyrophosphatase MutT (NUDIX family)